MIFLKVILCLIIFIVIPELLGLLLTKECLNEDNNCILAIILGYLFEFAIAQILIVPMIYAKISFYVLYYIYIRNYIYVRKYFFYYKF